MAINPLTRSSPIRMMGMASGFDTDNLIQQMMRVHQMRIDKQFRTRTMFEWKHQAHTDFKDQINDLRNTFLRSTGAQSVLNRNAYNSVVANVTGKNSSAVSIKTGSASPLGTTTIGQVVSLAKGSNVTSSGSVTGSGGPGLALASRLGDLSLPGGKIGFSDDVLSLTTDGGTSIEIIRDADGKYTYDDGTTVHELDFSSGRAEITTSGGETIELLKLGDGNLAEVLLDEDSEEYLGGVSSTEWGTADIEINGETIKLNRNMTISQMLSAVNSSDAGVTMSYDRLADKFTIENKEVGNGDLTVSGQALNLFGIADAGTTNPINNGTLAQVYINGELVERDTNNFDYRGINITLNHATSSGSTDIVDDIENDTTVTLKNDATNAISNIKSAVESLNSILKKIDDMLKDRKGINEKGYQPLTDEEKSVMSDKQIEEWESIAKKGLMRGDPGLQSLATKLRSEIYDSIYDKTTGKAVDQGGPQNYLSFSNGQIVIDEERLKIALEEDPDKVANFFAGIEGNKGTGLFYRINDAMTGFVNTSQVRSMKSLEDSIRRANEQMEKMTLKMYAEEDKLYKMFAAMETAMSKMQQQGDWFGAMLGNGK